ncbi:MAG: ABC transporter ATP-binding protein [Myxococcales bacterium]|nr:ABC transporter ATP-binding protein [Myxococcales bacterium]
MACAGLACGWPGGPAVVAGVDAAFPAGSVTAVIGPNGAGKSTLLRTLAGRLMPRAGQVTLGDAPLRAWAPKQAAQALAWLPQHPVAPPGLTARGLAERGRLPHRGPWWTGGDPQADAAAVTAALAAVDLADLTDRPLETLSGGERRRAWIALALAQGAHTLLLDEPTAALDPAAALRLGTLIRRLAAAGRAVVTVLHDVNLAARVADRVLALGGGGVQALGAPAQVLTPPLLRALYGIEARIIAGPGGAPHVVAEGPTPGPAG